MAVTMDSSASSYLTAAEFLKRCDARLVADLVSDSGSRVGAALATDANLAAALLDSSGELEAAAAVGKRYAQEDLATIAASATVGAARMLRLLTRLTVCLLWERRADKGPLPKQYEQALKDLELIRKGEQLLGPTVEHEAAGLPDSHVESPTEIRSRFLGETVARRFFGRVGDQTPPG